MSEIEPKPEHFEDPYVLQLIEALSRQQDEIEDLSSENRKLRLWCEVAGQAIKSGDWTVDGACDPGLDFHSRFACDHEWVDIGVGGSRCRICDARSDESAAASGRPNE